MILDSEKQRGLMLQIINAVEIRGTYQQVRETTRAIGDLEKAIMDAGVQQEIAQD